jgi:hypothetical protein
VGWLFWVGACGIVVLDVVGVCRRVCAWVVGGHTPEKLLF